MSQAAWTLLKQKRVVSIESFDFFSPAEFINNSINIVLKSRRSSMTWWYTANFKPASVLRPFLTPSILSVLLLHTKVWEAFHGKFYFLSKFIAKKPLSLWKKYFAVFLFVADIWPGLWTLALCLCKPLHYCLRLWGYSKLIL